MIFVGGSLCWKWFLTSKENKTMVDTCCDYNGTGKISENKYCVTWLLFSRVFSNEHLPVVDNYSWSCIKQPVLSIHPVLGGQLSKLWNDFSLNTIILTSIRPLWLRWIPKTCLYSHPPKLTGHLKWNHSKN